MQQCRIGSTEPADKRILRIEDAYANACAEAAANDVSLNQKKLVIQQKLQQIMAKMQHIKENQKSVTEKINRILFYALDEIDLHVRAKTDQLKSDRNELNRQLYEIVYAEAFIKRQSEQTDPLDFLNLHTGYIQVKNSLVN